MKMTSPIPSAPFEASALVLNDNDEAIEQYLYLLGDYRIYYQDLPLQISSLEHPHRKQASTCDEDSIGSETTTTLSLHTVPFSVTSMVAALHPPFAAVSPQLDTAEPMGDFHTITKCSSRRTMMEITPSTVPETPMSSMPSTERHPCHTAPLDSSSTIGAGQVKNLHSSSHRLMDSLQRTDYVPDTEDNSEQAVNSLTEAEDSLGFFGEAAGKANVLKCPKSPLSNPQIQKETESVDQRNPTRSVSSTSDPDHTPHASISVPKWIRIPPATEHRMKALQQRVRSAERTTLDLQTQLTASHVLVDALWDIAMDQQQKLNESLNPESISTTNKEIYYIHAARVQLQCWSRHGWWSLPVAAGACIGAVSYHRELWHVLFSILLLLWFVIPQLQYSRFLD
jgi:hypothetical protein